MSQDQQRGDGEAQLDRALAELLDARAQLPEARLRNIRLAVFARVAQQQYRLSDFFRWRVALPAALTLLFAGAALGWTVDQRLGESQDYMVGSVLVFGDF